MSTETITTEWVKQANWHGNPELGYDSYMKMFPTPSGRKVPVYLFGLPESNELSYCVSAGANSDYSYSGCFYPEKLNWAESMNRIDEMSNNKKLIY